MTRMAWLLAGLAAGLGALLTGTVVRAETEPPATDEHLKMQDADQVYVVLHFESNDEAKAKALTDSLQVRLRREAKPYMGEAYIASWIEIENRLGRDEVELARGLPDSMPEIALRLGLERYQELRLLYGVLKLQADAARAQINLYSVRNGETRTLWTREFAATGERWAVLISKEVIKHLLTVQVGEKYLKDQEIIKPTIEWGANIIRNSDFEEGGAFPKDWDKPDGLCTFWVKQSPIGTGRCLMYNTNVLQDQAWEWWKELAKGADPRKAPAPIRTKPPHYDSVGGIEGCKMDSAYYEIQPGPFVVSAVIAGPSGGDVRVFVKGYDLLPENRDTKLVRWQAYEWRDPSLPDKTLAEMSKPQMREVWRTYLHAFVNPTPKFFSQEFTVPEKLPGLIRSKLKTGTGEDEVFYPKVRWLKIRLYAMWPVGEYYFDNVTLRPGKILDEKPEKNQQTQPDRRHPPQDSQPKQ